MDLQTIIQNQLEELAASPEEHGLQVAVYHQGELVVNASAGYMDATTEKPVDTDTLFPVFSCSKGITATIVHRLAEARLIDYDIPIATVWPAFGKKGKEHITLRHVLTHAAGLWALPQGMDLNMIQDWEAACALMTELVPAHAPGAAIQYHAITYGWIVGALVCKASALSFPELLEHEICRPLGIRDLYIGLPDSEQSRVCTLYEDVDADDFNEINGEQAEAIPASVRPLYQLMNRPEARRACMPSGSGITNAKSLARHYAALLPGGVDGVQLLPDARIRNATERPEYPNYQGERPKWMLGFNTLDDWNQANRPLCFGHGGYGGSIGFADPNRQLAVAMTKNRFNTCDHTGQILQKIKDHFPLNA